jgi:hypothetical protein
VPLLGEVGPGEREDQLIRSVADRDLVGVDAVQRGQFGAQRAGERVRVAVRLQGGARDGGDHAGAGADRGLVGGQRPVIAVRVQARAVELDALEPGAGLKGCPRRPTDGRRSEASVLRRDAGGRELRADAVARVSARVRRLGRLR